MPETWYTEALRLERARPDPSSDLCAELLWAHKHLGEIEVRTPQEAFALAKASQEKGATKDAKALYLESHGGGCLAATLNLANLYNTADDWILAERLYRLVTTSISSQDSVHDDELQYTAIRATLGLGGLYRKQGKRRESRREFLSCFLLEQLQRRANGVGLGGEFSGPLMEELQSLTALYGEHQGRLLTEFEDLISSERPEMALVRMQSLEAGLKIGARVVLCGLTGAAGRLLNGRKGCLVQVGPPPGDSRRWQFQLDQEELRPAGTPLSGAALDLGSGLSELELDGFLRDHGPLKYVEILRDFQDLAIGALHAVIGESDSGASFIIQTGIVSRPHGAMMGKVGETSPPSPSLFSSGDAVELHGLSRRADLNGSSAVLQSFVGKTGRWGCHLSTSDAANPNIVVSVRPANLRKLQEKHVPTDETATATQSIWSGADRKFGMNHVGDLEALPKCLEGALWRWTRVDLVPQRNIIVLETPAPLPEAFYLSKQPTQGVSKDKGVPDRSGRAFLYGSPSFRGTTNTH